MSNHETIKLFPEPIFKYQFKNYKIINNELEKYIYKLYEEDNNGLERSNRGGLQNKLIIFFSTLRKKENSIKVIY